MVVVYATRHVEVHLSHRNMETYCFPSQKYGNLMFSATEVWRIIVFSLIHVATYFLQSQKCENLSTSVTEMWKSIDSSHINVEIYWRRSFDVHGDICATCKSNTFSNFALHLRDFFWHYIFFGRFQQLQLKIEYWQM